MVLWACLYVVKRIISLLEMFYLILTIFKIWLRHLRDKSKSTFLKEPTSSPNKTHGIKYVSLDVGVSSNQLFRQLVAFFIYVTPGAHQQGLIVYWPLWNLNQILKVGSPDVTLTREWAIRNHFLKYKEIVQIKSSFKAPASYPEIGDLLPSFEFIDQVRFTDIDCLNTVRRYWNHQFATYNPFHLSRLFWIICHVMARYQSSSRGWF